MQSFTSEEVEAHIRKYWLAFESKDAEFLQNAYTQAATIFTTSSKRVELGRLVSLHRQRIYLAGQSKIRIGIRDVFVHPLSDRGAVASYMLEFDAQRLAVHNAKKSDEHHAQLRVTHVLERGEDDEIRIVHEHLSVAESGN